MSSFDIKVVEERIFEVEEELEAINTRMVDPEYDLTEEERKIYDDATAELDKLTDRHQRYQSAVDNAKKIEGIRKTKEQPEEITGAHKVSFDRYGRADKRQYAIDVDKSIRGWMKIGHSLEPTQQELRSAERIGINVRAKSIEVRLSDNPDLYQSYLHRPKEMRMADTGAGKGGETIAPEFIRNLERALLAFGGMRQFSRILRTNTGARLTWPTIDDTTNISPLVAESTDGTPVTTAAVDIATSELVLDAFKTTSLITSSTELLEDDGVNLEGEMGTLLGERVGRRVNIWMTNGSGTGEPNGITNAAPQTTSIATPLGSDDLFTIFHDIDPAYRANPSVAWMMHDSVVAAIRVFRDDSGGAGTGQYLWQPGLQADVPDRILARPVIVNQDLPATLIDDAIIFGDGAKYILREVNTLRLSRADELFMQTDQVGFFVRWRGDGDLLNAGTNPVKRLNVT